MIEIKCTKRQKATIIAAALQGPDGCLWPQSQTTCCLNPKMTCQKCFESRIKWIHPEKKVKK